MKETPTINRLRRKEKTGAPGSCLLWIALAGFVSLPVQAYTGTIQSVDKCPERMSPIPAGNFFPGDAADMKKLYMDAFCIDQFEVTQAAFENVMRINPSFFSGPSRPVEKVTWDTASTYCRKLGKRLPTEWEWEKAAKGNTQTQYYWGDQMNDRYAWHRKNADKQTHPVGQKEPNAFGLYDMSGNVWEWTASDHENGGKVIRGGSWRNNPASLRSSHRIMSLPVHKFHYVGFRCAQ